MRDFAAHYAKDFKDFQFKRHVTTFDQCHTFCIENQGFDALFFGYRRNGDVVAFFIENKYTKSDSTSTKLKVDKIVNKHKAVKANMSKHSFIKDYYHIFVSAQKLPDLADLADLRAQNINWNNLCIIDSNALKSYYGPCWSDITNYFHPTNKAMQALLIK